MISVRMKLIPRLKVKMIVCAEKITFFSNGLTDEYL